MSHVSFRTLERLIKTSLADFYRRRIVKLQGLDLKATLRRKNPYLFRATGVQKASEIVKDLLRAYVSSSDETIFGDAFFEPIAKIVTGGTVSDGYGVDVLKETKDRCIAISVKSGPNWGNSSQRRRQVQDFEQVRQRLLKTHKAFDALLGYGYGRKLSDPAKDHPYRERSGQAFWEELTGDPEFYLKLMRLMKDYPRRHRQQYKLEWSKAVNRFEREFLIAFSMPSGEIDWEKFARFNSGKR
ncbi:MAG: cytoplasmic protein [Candidatus Omnitrophica bacterium]|nr:cytoplasmic protein [Candidatus Omnitrophota bacterium]